MSPSDLLPALPFIIVSVWAILLLLFDLFISNKGITAILAAAGVAAALVAVIARLGSYQVAFNGMIVADSFSDYLQIVILATALLGIAVAYDYLRRMNMERGEYYTLMLFTVSGMLLMSLAGDLILVFLAIELLSLPLYVLSGFARPEKSSEEAAMKYFILGAFSSAFLVYGIALIFGSTGTTNMAGVAQSIAGDQADPTLMIIAVPMLLVGLGFKVAAVPFHMWTPDVYEGAPSAAVAFMSVGAKVAGFAALLRIFVAALPELAPAWGPVVIAVSAATMIWGNVAAIAQSNIKRMLAYSSIAHAGYILMALAAASDPTVADKAVSAALFYLFAYLFSNLGAWAVVLAMERSKGGGLRIEDYAGLGRRRPALALAMAIFMLSLIGVPPTAGFIGKFLVFGVTIEAGLIGLAIVGVVTTLISAYYYLRVVVMMYMRTGEPESRSEGWLNRTVGLTALATFLLGVLPGPILILAGSSGFITP
ncbi:MAG: NADH-quinone oxidoreductase subunit N [Chloroflexi bacterium]|nr:NADH-quinone oxidoreductase subunit N [Chloroflexota bacterium]